MEMEMQYLNKNVWVLNRKRSQTSLAYHRPLKAKIIQEPNSGN